MRRFFCAAFLLCPLPGLAEPPVLTLPPGATVSAERTQAATSYGLPIGPWRNDTMARNMLEGTRADTAWRLRGNQETSLQILAPLRAQIVGAGYILIYQCETETCGGFDFRYALDLLPEPEMHVDLGDFRYLAAQNGQDWIALTVSRSSESGFVHLTTMTAEDATPAQPDNDLARPQLRPEPDHPAGDLAKALEQTGKVALDDLVFASGASQLAEGDFATLSALADYLATRPEARIALVGHTDNSGALAANVALSRDRAAAVRKRLVERLGVPAGQLTAEGAGWLSPRASNLTPEGREKNRRVEAVLASTPR